MKKEYLYTDRIILFNVNVFIQIVDFNQEKRANSVKLCYICSRKIKIY